MKYVLALCAVLSMGCTPTKDADTIEFERQVGEYLDRDDFILASSTIDERVKAKGADKVAPSVVQPILAKWPNIEKAELENAAILGKNRALGKGSDSCVGCVLFRKTMGTLAPASPELDTRWKTLQPKLEQAETAAYDTEKSDKRPIVVVWQRGSGGSNAAVELVSICFVESLRKAFPQYKWLAESKAPASEAAQFEVTGRAATDKFVDSQTQKEAAQLLSGLRIAITPRHLDATLAPRFTGPLEARARAESPDTIRSDLPIGGPPTVEAVREGMKQIEKIRTEVCASLDKQVQLAATLDTAAPAASQKQ